MKRADFSYAIRAVLAAAVGFYAYRLSASGRGWIDWAVLGLAAAAVAWNLVQLGRRFHAAGQPRALAHLGRTLCFWTVGVMNTVLRPEPFDSWKVAVGWLMLLLAAIDTIWLWRKERAVLTRPHPPVEGVS
jgi:hypothetical protein